MILIDNYDSFTYNIVQYLKILGCNPIIFKNDEISVNDLKNMKFSSIIISPGPKSPKSAGISNDVIKTFYKSKKVLGICLGHQCIANVFGGKIVKAKTPCHGKTSKIYFKESPIFSGLEQGFDAMRYHSLVVNNNFLPDSIEPLAYTDDKILMALKIKNYKTYGVQFHPESILTDSGIKLLENFLYLV